MKKLREILDLLRGPRRLRRLPRAARAYLAGIGTSGSLLAGAALMFILASALVAFRGWPHVGAPPSPGEVVVSPRPVSATGSPSARRLAFFSVAPVAAPATRAGGRRALVVLGGGRGRAVAPATRRSIGTPVSTSRPVAGSTGASPTGGGSGPTCTAGCGGAPAAGSAPAPTQPIQQAAGSLGNTLSGAGSGAGTVVSGAGSGVSTVVQQTANGVAGALQGVSPPAAGVVKSAGSGAANTVGGVTQGIAGALSGITKH